MLLKKIKTNYLDKLFSDLVNQNEFLKIHHELDKLKNEDIELYFLFQNRILNTYLNNDVGQSFFQNKIIWLNSFDLDDTKIIENFLSFYLNVKLNVNLNGGLYLNEFQKLPKVLIPSTNEKSSTKILVLHPPDFFIVLLQYKFGDVPENEDFTVSRRGESIFFKL